MSSAIERPEENLSENHTLAKSILFKCKAFVLRSRRFFQNTRNGIHRHSFGSKEDFPCLLSSSTSPLWDLTDERELRLTMGKVQNLRIAAQALNGLSIPQNNTFSFWTQLGKLTRSKGYVSGRELRSGCVVPSIGGGICQLSNALYDAALKAGFKIIERHSHTIKTQHTPDYDATVFWNYVDLRFQPSQDVCLEVFLDRENFQMRFWGKEKFS